jgi:competence protein ComEA
MPAWSKIVRNYFTFNRRERRGVYVLIIVILILSITHLFIRLTPGEIAPLTEEELAVIADFEAYQKAAKLKEIDEIEIRATTTEEVEWKSFDLNRVSVSELEAFGLEHRIAQRIDNYRTKGGKFYNIEDVARIYDMPTNWLEAASGYLEFPTRENEVKTGKYQAFQPRDSITHKKKPVISVIDLNDADSAALVSVPWIGPFYAKEIVKLRTGLGGFRSYDQLTEIYMIRDEAIESLIKYSTIDETKIIMININKCDVASLGKHPYLTWKQAKTIINYRFQHGEFKTIEGIKETDVISDSVYVKIAPYLTTE